MVKCQQLSADNKKLKTVIMTFSPRGNLTCIFYLNLLDYLWTFLTTVLNWKPGVSLFDCKASEQQQQKARMMACMCACSRMNGWVYEHRLTSVLGVHNTIWDLTALTEQQEQTGWSCWLRWKIYSAMIWDQSPVALAELTWLLEVYFFFPAVSTERPKQIQTVGSIVEQTVEARCQWH